MKSKRSAFTLVELLVVISLIAVLSGIVGLTLGRGNSGAALQSSQATLQGIFSSARGQAAIGQNTANVVVNVDPNSDGFLREFYILMNGQISGSSISLSQGIHVVPRTTTTTYGGAVTFTTPGSWTNRLSDIFIGTPVTMPQGVSGSYAQVVGIDERGVAMFGSGAGIKLILAPAEKTAADRITFTNPEAVRGVSLSQYGVLTMLNNADAMQN